MSRLVPSSNRALSTPPHASPSRSRAFALPLSSLPPSPPPDDSKVALLKSQFEQLERLVKSNSAQLRSLYSQVATEEARHTSMTDFLTVELRRQQSQVVRFTAFIESLKEQQQREREEMISSYEASLKRSYDLFIQHQAEQISKYEALTTEIDQMQDVEQERHEMEQRIEMLKRKIEENELQREKELSELKEQIENEKTEILCKKKATSPDHQQHQHGDGDYRRNVVRMIENEKTTLLAECEKLKVERRERSVLIASLKKENTRLLHLKRTLKQRTELDDEQLKIIEICLAKRNLSLDQISESKLHAEETLANTIIEHDISVAQPLITDEQLAALNSNIQIIKAQAEHSVAEEKSWRRRGEILLKERQECERLLILLLEDFRDEHKHGITQYLKNTSRPQPEADEKESIIELNPSTHNDGDVSLAQLTNKQKYHLITILFSQLTRQRPGLTSLPITPSTKIAISDDYSFPDKSVGQDADIQLSAVSSSLKLLER